MQRVQVFCKALGALAVGLAAALALAQAPVAPHVPVYVPVQILAINDFHGALASARTVTVEGVARPVGGAAVLAAYLQAAQAAMPGRSLIVHVGDHVGGSPPISGLLREEPSIMWFNLLGNSTCSDTNRMAPGCNLVGALGNHEFDAGVPEMLRLLHGGDHPAGPLLQAPWRGANYTTLAANVLDRASGRPIVAPYEIKQVGGVRVAFVGAVTRTTPTVVTPEYVAHLQFLDEAEAINRTLPEIQAQGVQAIVALIHEGGRQRPAEPGGSVEGRIVDIVARLDGAVDLVLSAHTHGYTHARLPKRDGQPVLVTQAWAHGAAYSDTLIHIDPATQDVVTTPGHAPTASICTTFADVMRHPHVPDPRCRVFPDGSAIVPHGPSAALVAAAAERVAPIVNRAIGVAPQGVPRAQNEAGESALGNLIADAQRAVAPDIDFAFMNPGGIRADVPAGNVTYGHLHTVQPFGNALVRMHLTGDQVYALLEQQWVAQPFPRILQVSGLSVTWDAARPVGSRVVEVRRDGRPIDRGAHYAVVVNSFLAAGGDNFTVLTQGTGTTRLALTDLEQWIRHMQAPTGSAGVIQARIEGRIQRVN